MASVTPSSALTSAAARLTAVSRDDVSLVGEPYVGHVHVHVHATAHDELAALLRLEALPAANRVAETPAGSVLWLAPRQFLLLTRAERATAIVAALSDALPWDRGVFVDLSASVVGLTLSGPRARDVLASCCALDLHPRTFVPGHCARTLIAKAPVTLLQADDVPSYRLVVRNSLAAYVVDWLVDGIEGLE